MLLKKSFFCQDHFGLTYLVIAYGTENNLLNKLRDFEKSSTARKTNQLESKNFANKLFAAASNVYDYIFVIDFSAFLFLLSLSIEPSNNCNI